jgi:hypothetical protein
VHDHAFADAILAMHIGRWRTKPFFYWLLAYASLTAWETFSWSLTPKDKSNYANLFYNRSYLDDTHCPFLYILLIENHSPMSLMTLCRSLGTSFVMWNWQSITRHEVLIITFKEHKKNISLFFFFLRRKIAEEDLVWKLQKKTKNGRQTNPMSRIEVA